MKITSLQAHLNELDEKRIKSLSVAADTPRVGIFWLHVKDGKVKILHAIPKTIEYGSNLGKFIIASEDHYNIWDSIKKYFNAEDIEYDFLPRGRVAYDTSTKQYVVQHGPYISKAGAKQAIISEFKLPSNTRWEPDEHYAFEEWSLPE